MTPKTERESWQFRALLHCKETHQKKLAHVLMAAMGRVPPNPPYLGLTAVIDVDGRVYTDFVDEHRVVHEATFFCPVQDMVDALRRLRDALALDDEETVEFFDTVRRWIERDERAIQNKDGDHNGNLSWV